MKDIVILSSLKPFAKGGNRLCYVDPRDQNRCIKVLLPLKSPRIKKAQAIPLKRLRPLSYFDDNLRELKSYYRIEAMVGARAWAHLPRCYGLVETDLGVGIVTEIVRDSNTAVSQDLRSKLREFGFNPALREALKIFLRYLEDTCLPTRDLLLHNLVAQHSIKADTYKIYVIDGFGSSDMIPYVYWFKFLARRKVSRKIRKFESKIAAFCLEESIPGWR